MVFLGKGSTNAGIFHIHVSSQQGKGSPVSLCKGPHSTTVVSATVGTRLMLKKTVHQNGGVGKLNHWLLDGWQTLSSSLFHREYDEYEYTPTTP